MWSTERYRPKCSLLHQVGGKSRLADLLALSGSAIPERVFGKRYLWHK